jgi:tellurite resistance protein TehA-like permease
MIALVCVESWGHGWGIFAYVLWWIGAFGSTFSMVTFTFIMYASPF